MIEISIGKRSWKAMLMSLVVPGLGQFYLRKWEKGIVIFLAVLTGLLIYHINSQPPGTEFVIMNWTGGRKIMFKPVRILMYTGAAQALIAWFYGIIDGWRGRKRFKPGDLVERTVKADENR